MLREGLVLATLDHRITLDELSQFVAMAAEYHAAALPPLGRVRAPATVK
jgi:hypothetical protein